MTDYNLIRLKELLNSNILSKNELCSNSVFIEVLVLLRDLVSKAEKINKKIVFDDYIDKKKLTFGTRDIHINDITDLIKYFRDAAVHSHTVHRNNSVGGSLAFCKIFGKSQSFGISSEFEDDVCFVFGGVKLYLYRHIHRLTKELEDVLSQ
ncbi:MAG TPA: hypothetical protein DEH15_20000 [Marinilabiliales bacterium]|nr:hypothetical protein [Marinilabiliales bacterium]